jgi:SseB protein N-terminal domain
MRDALAASDQEHYFRILSRTDLLLPVSADALAGRAPMGWGTWTTGNRTHVLAFTSPMSLAICLSDRGASYRVLPFHTLAAQWPNYEWWLAINPGLPIEAYLPSWFVSQLTRGDVRLPGRPVGAQSRLSRNDLASAVQGRNRATATAAAGGRIMAEASPLRGHEPANGRSTIAPQVETVEAEIVEPAPEPRSARYPGPVATDVRADSGRYETPLPPRPAPPPREAEYAHVVSPQPSWSAGFAGFAAANETESNLLNAVQRNDSDAFLSTLLLARVIVPVPAGTAPTARPRDRDFPWQVRETDNQRYIAVFTSPERLAEHNLVRGGGDTSVSLRFVQLIGAWPDEQIAFAINPGSPIGAMWPGSQIVTLASWAAEVGLRDNPSADMVVTGRREETVLSVGVAGAPTAASDYVTVMQRAIPPTQLPFYLERGYDRVSGFVNRASEIGHLTTPRSLYRALGLLYAGSPFSEDDADVHLLRWVAYRIDLYRIPYGGQHEAAMRAMQGWVIERPPFRGNGFAPGDTEVVAEFKVDSVRLPHGAQIWRVDKFGSESLMATFEADSGRWIATAAFYRGADA